MKKKIFIPIIIVLVITIGLICISKIKKSSNEQQETLPYLLQADCKIIEENVTKGMTIKDNYGNEWVWVVVPKTSVFKTAKNEEDYGNIENDIKEYTKNYVVDKYEDSGTIYKDLKEKTLKSIYKYGGFWISRYEIGCDEIRISKTANEVVPLSKQDVYVYNYVSFNQAESLAKKISNSEYESNLLFGFQWDLVCKFIEENGYTNEGDKITEQMINANSSLWGNYYTSSFSINRGKYSTDYGKTYINANENEIKKQYKNYLLTTGASEQNKACNIYDFSGNVSEWTLENLSTRESQWNVIRDGNFYFNYGGNDPVSGRYEISTNSSNASYGFRVMCIKED